MKMFLLLSEKIPYCQTDSQILWGESIPFSSGTSDAGIKAEPNRLSAVIAKEQRFFSYRRYLHRTYRLLHIVNKCTVRLRTVLRTVRSRSDTPYLSTALNRPVFTPATRTRAERYALFKTNKIGDQTESLKIFHL